MFKSFYGNSQVKKNQKKTPYKTDYFGQFESLMMNPEYNDQYDATLENNDLFSQIMTDIPNPGSEEVIERTSEDTETTEAELEADEEEKNVEDTEAAEVELEVVEEEGSEVELEVVEEEGSEVELEVTQEEEEGSGVELEVTQEEEEGSGVELEVTQEEDDVEDTEAAEAEGSGVELEVTQEEDDVEDTEAAEAEGSGVELEVTQEEDDVEDTEAAEAEGSEVELEVTEEEEDVEDTEAAEEGGSEVELEVTEEEEDVQHTEAAEEGGSEDTETVEMELEAAEEEEEDVEHTETAEEGGSEDTETAETELEAAEEEEDDVEDAETAETELEAAEEEEEDDVEDAGTAETELEAPEEQDVEVMIPALVSIDTTATNTNQVIDDNNLDNKNQADVLPHYVVHGADPVLDEKRSHDHIETISSTFVDIQEDIEFLKKVIRKVNVWTSKGVDINVSSLETRLQQIVIKRNNLQCTFIDFLKNIASVASVTATNQDLHMQYALTSTTDMLKVCNSYYETYSNAEYSINMLGNVKSQVILYDKMGIDVGNAIHTIEKQIQDQTSKLQINYERILQIKDELVCLAGQIDSPDELP